MQGQEHDCSLLPTKTLASGGETRPDQSGIPAVFATYFLPGPVRCSIVCKEKLEPFSMVGLLCACLRRSLFHLGCRVACGIQIVRAFSRGCAYALFGVGRPFAWICVGFKISAGGQGPISATLTNEAR